MKGIASIYMLRERYFFYQRENSDPYDPNPAENSPKLTSFATEAREELRLPSATNALPQSFPPSFGFDAHLALAMAFFVFNRL